MQYYPMHHKPRKLSVIGAMKDIQQYKIMKAQADLAPTLAEKARIEWDWKKKDRAKDVRIKELDIKKAERGEVEAKRELMTEILTESAQIAKDAFEKTTTQEEFTAYLQNAYTRLKEKGPQYADELEDKDGNNIIDLAEIPRDKAMEIHAGFLARKEKLKPLAAGARMIDPETGEVVVEAEYKPTTTLTLEQRKELETHKAGLKPEPTALTLEERKELEAHKAGLKDETQSWISTDKEGKQWISTRNADGTVTTVPVEGTTGKPSKPPGAGTGKERERATLIAKLPQYEAEAKVDPNKLYAQKAIRLDENAKPTVDAFGAPVVLPTFESIAGKRGAPKAFMAMGEQYDDAVELQTLLNDPKVADDLRREVDSGLLDRIRGKTFNKLNKWMAEKGILADSNTATAIRRMQRLASEERKLFMGVAVTELEIRSALAWMPDAADSYDAMINKINLMAQEGEQHFRRYMDVYKNKANMAPYYKAWDLQRFYKQPDGTWSEQEPSEHAAQLLINKYRKQ